MPKVFFSITSLEIDKLNSIDEIEVSCGTVQEILEQLNSKFPGIKPFIVDENGKIRSRAIITKNVIPENSLLFMEKEQSS